MPMDKEIMEIVIAVKDQATAAIMNVEGALSKLGGTASIVSGILAGGFLAGSVRAFADFDEAMQESIAIMGDVDAAMREKLVEGARAVAREMAISHEEAARSYYYLASAGLSAEEALKAMPAVARLAEAGALDMAEATDIATDIMTAFGKSVEDLVNINDILVATVTKSNTNLQMLGEAMKYVAPSAHAVGWELSEVSAAIGMLSNAGIKGATAGVYLRQAIAQLLDPSDKAKKAMESLGLTMEDLDPRTHSLAEIVSKLKEAGADIEDLTDIFGVRAATAMQILVEQGGGALKEFTQELENSKGITEDVAKTQEQTLNKQLKILKNNLNDLAISVGEQLVPALNDLIEHLLKLMEAYNKLPEPVKENVAKFTALAAVAVTVLSVLKAIMGVVGMLKGVAGLAGLTSSAGSVTAAFGSLASAAGTIVSALSGVVSAVAAVLGVTVGAAAAIIAAIVAVIAVVVAYATNWHGARDKINAAVRDIYEKVRYYVGVAAEKFREFVNKVRDYAQKMVESLRTKLGRVVEIITAPYRRAFSEVMNIASRFVEIGRAIVEGLKRGLSNLADTIKHYLTDPISDAVDSIKEKLGIHSPSRVYEDIGRNIVEGYKRGLERLDPKDLILPAPVPRPLPVPAPEPGVPGGPGGPVTIHVDLSGSVIRDPADVDRLVDEIERRIAERLIR